MFIFSNAGTKRGRDGFSESDEWDIKSGMVTILTVIVTFSI